MCQISYIRFISSRQDSLVPHIVHWTMGCGMRCSKLTGLVFASSVFDAKRAVSILQRQLVVTLSTTQWPLSDQEWSLVWLYTIHYTLVTPVTSSMQITVQYTVRHCIVQSFNLRRHNADHQTTSDKTHCNNTTRTADRTHDESTESWTIRRTRGACTHARTLSVNRHVASIQLRLIAKFRGAYERQSNDSTKWNIQTIEYISGAHCMN